MNKQIVIIGAGEVGTLAANHLRAALDRSEYRIVVIDRTDYRDQELDLLVAIGIYGPRTLRPPEHLRLRDGTDFRLADAATVDTDRREVCLTDGTTLPYHVLVLATGRHPLPRGVVRGTPAAWPATRHPDVFAVRGKGASWPAAEQPAHMQVERLVGGVRLYLDAGRRSGGGVAAASRA